MLLFYSLYILKREPSKCFVARIYFPVSSAVYNEYVSDRIKQRSTFKKDGFA